MPEEKQQEKEAGISAFSDSGRKVGDYLLGQMIGSGETGSVFLARQISTQRLVAVKILRSGYSADPVCMERFFREVCQLARLNDPHIVQAIEAGLDQRTCYFAMEYVDGRDLRTELAIRERLPEKEVLTIARDTARAMACAWNSGRMIHGNIKPASIMRTRTGLTKLLDLGISKMAGRAGKHTPRKAAGLMIDSPVYTSPEQARGSREIDFHSDIYSLGITMYHLLAGRPPFDSPGSGTEARHLADPVSMLLKESAVTPGTSALIREMIAREPGGRPGSWEEIERRTVKLLGQFDTVPSPLSGEESGRGGILGRLFQGNMFLVCLIVLLITAVFLAALIIAVRKKRMYERSPFKVNKEKVVVPSASSETGAGRGAPPLTGKE